MKIHYLLYDWLLSKGWESHPVGRSFVSQLSPLKPHLNAQYFTDRAIAKIEWRYGSRFIGLTESRHGLRWDQLQGGTPPANFA